ncbi:hypothetical protein DM01DRAFT_1282559 [Hesseltinella vesiculosa]|uniref:C2 domain-containing protein n=1 Tax=Hesseltinella vesiculosa TaxID=101127 RepID=A0A1X2GR31_9FUNG|nr:hypothetical protein DM01DRAFT_1282559 [Hesseltinella vesiculosa]
MIGSLSDRFTDDGKKQDRLTREVVRALLRRLDDIKKGKDISKPEYDEPIFLATVAQMQKNVLVYRFRPSGTINDLVVMYAGVAKTECQKASTKSWSDDLNRYLPLFANIVKLTVVDDCPSSASPDLIDRLHGYMGLGRPSRQPSVQSTTPSTSLAYGSVESFENFTMVKTVRQLFQVDPVDLRKKLRELQPICTQAAFMRDLKKCLHNIHTNHPFPCNTSDFTDRQSYDAWQKRETNQLSGLVKTLTLMDPSLATAPASEEDPHRSSNGFTFIPDNPRGYFERMMNMCMDFDTQVIPSSERAKTSVLSQQSDELLRECFRTWRLTSSFRAVLYLQLIKDRYDRGIFGFDDITEGLHKLDRAIKETEVHAWTMADRTNLIWAYEGLERTFMRQLADGLREYWRMSPLLIEDSVKLVDRIYEDPAYLSGHPDPSAQYQEMEVIVEGAAVTRWRLIQEGSNSPGADDLANLFSMADKLTKELVSLVTKKFKKPIKGVLSVPGVVMTIQMPYFALEIENWAYLPETRSAPIEAVFELYHKLCTLKRLYDQHGPQEKAQLFKVESWFSSHVRRWLQTTDNSTPEWVDNAIRQDHFVATNSTTLHSSSIVDLFSLFHQAVDFVQNLQWPNQYQWCRFMTALSRVIAVALTQYTYALEDRITQDIYPHLHDRATEGDHSFLDRAKLQLIGNRSSLRLDTLPEDFTPQMCVKINNIEAARSRLDRLYQTMDVDEIAEYFRENGAPTADKEEKKNYLYSIRVVRAENLVAKDSNGLSDPYVVLEINDKQVARTRTVYETLNPRWDQTFDLWLDNKTIDVSVIVFDEDLLTAHDECGAAFFRLSPKFFDDYQTHDIVLDLQPQGRLLLRVSMEGEKDDIQFWYGKTFRTLKRAENDAAGLIVDKMGRYIRQCLSRKVIDRLLGRAQSFFSFGSRQAKHVELTLADYEDAIAPLLDFLERNLKLLNDNLSESNMQLVVLKIWREILIALESIVLPPLSEQLSDMKPLDEYEFDVVNKWLELLKVFFNGGEDGDAVPLDKLENAQYYTLLAINVAYDMETHQLMQTYHKALQQQVEIKQRGGRKADRSKSIYQSKNTMRKRRDAAAAGKRLPNPPSSNGSLRPTSTANAKAAAIDLPTADVILRILRMRSGKEVREFLRTEFDKRNNPGPPPPPPHTVAKAVALEDPSPAPSGLPSHVPPLPPMPATSPLPRGVPPPPTHSLPPGVPQLPPMPSLPAGSSTAYIFEPGLPPPPPPPHHV